MIEKVKSNFREAGGRNLNLYVLGYVNINDQPSGHINVSRAREFYILYESSVITSVNLGQLIVVASALNFLLISDQRYFNTNRPKQQAVGSQGSNGIMNQHDTVVPASACNNRD